MHDLKEFITYALREDIGHGDITTEILIDEQLNGSANLIAKESFVLAGIGVAHEVFRQVDPAISFRTHFNDGDEIQAVDILATVSGRLSSLLKAERVALNILQRLSGIATTTKNFVSHLEGTRAAIVDTRKTTPCMRALEKYAVVIGGGRNHRFGLYDGILIKDNHIKAAGGITKAVKRAKERASHMLRVEVEAETIDQVNEAIMSGADIIMLDNMSLALIMESVSLIKGRAIVEVSGGVNLDNVREIAETGVDLISAGCLTHSVRSVDISMEIDNNNIA